MDEAASRRTAVTEWLEAVDLVLLQRPILARASDPFPTPLGTLDALHLATAPVWRERMREPLVMATHDGGWRSPRVPSASRSSVPEPALSA